MKERESSVCKSVWMAALNCDVCGSAAGWLGWFSALRCAGAHLNERAWGPALLQALSTKGP